MYTAYRTSPINFNVLLDRMPIERPKANPKSWSELVDTLVFLKQMEGYGYIKSLNITETVCKFS